GLSATPFSPKLGAVYDAVVNARVTNQLIADGWLTPLRVVAATAEVNTEGVPVTSTGEWERDALGKRTMQITGEIVPEWTKQTDRYFDGPVPTIVFCPTVADCEETAAKFQDAGHDFRVIHYRQSADEKQVIIEAFRLGKHDGLISCASLARGFDVPHVRCMIDAYPLKKSLATHIQRLGRTMRPAPGKEYGLIIDHSSNYVNFMDAMHDFFSSGVTRLGDGKLHDTERKGVQQIDSACKQCGVVFQRGDKNCQGCGAEKPEKPKPKLRPTLTESVADMGEIDVVDGESRTAKKTRQLREAYPGDWWPEICIYAAGIAPSDPDRQLKIARAAHKGLFDCWPRQRDLVLPEDRRDAHPVVAQACAKNRRQYFAKNNRRRKAAKT
ncbi:MAG: helicase-related protein, partial [Rhodococcus sp.]|nr:helicase-related protein [Rhodococcus sp. (in: high G+C Gram-positive bacteria)]